MTKLAAVCIETCLSCNHFGYCMVLWGTECKRQGGKRTPRMKSMSVKTVGKAGKQIRKKKDKPRQVIIDVFEPIRTKRVNWGLTGQFDDRRKDQLTNKVRDE